MYATTDLIEKSYAMGVLMPIFLSKRMSFTLDTAIARHGGRLTAALLSHPTISRSNRTETFISTS